MDKDILQGCVNGERLSQKKLYEKYYSKMMAVCMRYAHSRDEGATILNEGFYKVFTKISGFDIENGNVEAWIYRIMVNTSIDHYRQEVKQRNIKELDVNVHNHHEDSSNVISQLSAEDIIELIQKLPTAYRTVFNMYVMEGMSHKEIGETLQISEGTSKSNLFKAKAKMKELVEKKFSINYKMMES
ncbi:MAG: RNA polymerase sigma factor [Bacteroidota bacterium]